MKKLLILFFFSVNTFAEFDTDPGYEVLPEIAYMIQAKIQADKYPPQVLVDLAKPFLECDYHYFFVYIDSTEHPEKTNSLYALAHKNASTWVYGINYRFDANNEHSKLTLVKKSTKGCFETEAIPEGKALPELVALPNLVGEPNELHILLSLMQGFPLVLFSENDYWLIYGSTVRKEAK